MKATATQVIPATRLLVGDIAYFYGAEFEITEVRSAAPRAWDGSAYMGPSDTVIANGKWLAGAIEPHYFGPTLDWVFQGNHRRTITIRAR